MVNRIGNLATAALYKRYEHLFTENSPGIDVPYRWLEEKP